MNNNHALMDPGLPATCPACYGDCRMPNGEPCLACQHPLAGDFLDLDLALTRTRIAPRPLVIVSTPARAGDSLLHKLVAGAGWPRNMVLVSAGDRPENRAMLILDEDAPE